MTWIMFQPGSELLSMVVIACFPQPQQATDGSDKREGPEHWIFKCRAPPTLTGVDDSEIDKSVRAGAGRPGLVGQLPGLNEAGAFL